MQLKATSRSAPQRLAVGEVNALHGRLKLRLSPQTHLDPARLMAWVKAQKDASLSPDGTLSLPLRGGVLGPIRQAQEVLREWAGG